MVYLWVKAFHLIFVIAWMAGLFYPDKWDGDLREEARLFYQRYYHVDLSDEELDRLLEWAEGQPPR